VLNSLFTKLKAQKQPVKLSIKVPEFLQETIVTRKIAKKYPLLHGKEKQGFALTKKAGYLPTNFSRNTSFFTIFTY